MSNEKIKVLPASVIPGGPGFSRKSCFARHLPPVWCPVIEADPESMLEMERTHEFSGTVLIPAWIPGRHRNSSTGSLPAPKMVKLYAMLGAARNDNIGGRRLDWGNVFSVIQRLLSYKQGGPIGLALIIFTNVQMDRSSKSFLGHLDGGPARFQDRVHFAHGNRQNAFDEEFGGLHLTDVEIPVLFRRFHFFGGHIGPPQQ